MNDKGSTIKHSEQSMREKWLEEVERTLKGKQEHTLHQSTVENIILKTLYSESDTNELALDQYPGQGENVRGYRLQSAKQVDCCQPVSHPNPVESNKKLRSFLEQGQNVIAFTPHSVMTRGKMGKSNLTDGVSVLSIEDVANLLHGIDLSKYPFFVYAGLSATPLISLIAAYCKRENDDLKKLKGIIAMDPIGAFVEGGESSLPLTDVYNQWHQLIQWQEASGIELKTMMVRSQPYHAAGATIVQELAYALATAADYVHEGRTRGSSLDQIGKQLVCSFSVGSQTFMEIAKLRAFRSLFTRMMASFDESYEPAIYLHGETSAQTKTSYDAYNNMLRVTTEAFSALVGGVEGLTILPFDQRFSKGTDFSFRMARNTLFILEQESYLTKVTDPAGGSYYVESMTQSLIDEAWNLFLTIEENGGMTSSIKSGFIHKQIEEAVAKRGAKPPVAVGVTHYVNAMDRLKDASYSDIVQFGEEQENRLNAYASTETHTSASIAEWIEAYKAGAFITEQMKSTETGERVAPLPKFQPIAELEDLRTQFVRLEDASFSVVVLGDTKEAYREGDRTKNFVQMTGLPVTVSPLCLSVEEALLWMETHDKAVIILCGEHDLKKALNQRLLESSPQRVVIETEEVDERPFINVRGKQLEQLQKLFTLLEVAKHV
ncbi:methylmalonyl-CoA mutase family protein [Priestia koreensis]|uniref:methylmalonyl-CoA mutase family protein n=1 Tax=Priestia koreensis TaxID=284581 RepID=UPI00203CDDC8|nr:methylmalonyl-CoA mutase family protein [Priestia koreensis]MCM3002401.1 methylmalonyl-CoA mutase family protein [Priestia koreensis]